MKQIIAWIRTILNWVKSKLSQRQFLYFSSALVGVSVGLAAVGLKKFVHIIFVIASFNKAFAFNYFYLLLPMIGIFLTVLVIRLFLKKGFEKGLFRLHYRIAKKGSAVPKEQMYGQIITSSLTIGLGGSSGLEAPIAITGAAFGSNYGETYGLDYKDKTLLLACGAAAGIASAFNAPIAGVLFALEVLLLDISISGFIPLIIAAAFGALVSGVLLEDDILLKFSLREPFNYQNVPFYFMLGLLAGYLSFYHAKVFEKVEKWFPPKHPFLNVFVGGTMLAGLIYLFPSLFGEGYSSIKTLSMHQPGQLLKGSFFSGLETHPWPLLAFVALVMLVKPVATAITLGSGGNGGNFAPSLFVGAYMGFVLSRAINLLHIGKVPESNFTLVGMAGLLSGLYHAPLTAIFLIAEITNGYSLMIPLMIVSSISYAVSKYLSNDSMEARKLRSLGHILTENKDKSILAQIQTKDLVERDFTPISKETKLGELVKIIGNCKRNIFPVLDANGRLEGVVLLDQIRSILFRQEFYETKRVKEFMSTIPAILNEADSMDYVVNQFDQTQTWNLPVVDGNGKYLGFLSKSTVFSQYRKQLIESCL
jgi:chloride channel protein, CIC family